MRENLCMLATKVRRERGPRSGPVMCTMWAGACCPAPAETRAAALLAPTAGAAETNGSPCVSTTPTVVRKPFGFDDTLKSSNRHLTTLRQ